MKIVIAPDSYKESLTALEVANEIEAGFREVFPKACYIKLPVADGGEGTVQAMVEATCGRRVDISVTGPLGEPVEAFYGLTGDGETAVIEMAAASGLALVAEPQRNPRITTSYGTGELILAALNAGVRNFIIGIGGSATNDGGAGMLQALGAALLDAEGKSIRFGGEALRELDRIDLSGFDSRIAQSTINVACDVNNPLCGPQGASAIFGPQKGASPETVWELDACLKRFGQIIKRDLGADVLNVPGAGAAGGMGAAMVGVVGGRLRPGSDIITEAVGLDDAVKDADLVITGEGRIDGQTVFGKTPIGVARVAKRYGKPVIGIAGCLTREAPVVHEHGIEAIVSVLFECCSVPDALSSGAFNVRLAARNVAAMLKIGQLLPS